MPRSRPEMHPNDAKARDSVATARDPVCGMTVKMAPGARSAVHDGATYYFCGERCRVRFTEDPARYLAPAEPMPPAPHGDARIYTCPMHPEVRQVGPGSCPICGMALEPVEASVAEGDDPELRDMSRRLAVCAVPTLLLFAAAMADMLPGRPVSHAIPHGA